MSPKMTAAHVGGTWAPMAYHGSTPVLPYVTGAPVYVRSDLSRLTTASGHEGFPGLARLDDGTLVAVYRQSLGHAGNAGTLYCFSSTDGGVTWSTPFEFVAQYGKDFRDPALTVLSDGRLVCQFFRYDYATGTHEAVLLSYSSDSGATWTSPALVPFTWTERTGCSGPVVETSPGTLLVFAHGRSVLTDLWSIRCMTSTDNGVTWGDETTILDGETTGHKYVEAFGGLLNDGRVMVHIRDEHVAVRRRIIRDVSGTWGTATGVQTGVKGRPVWMQLASGRIIAADRTSSDAQTVWMTAKTPDANFGPLTELGPDEETAGAYLQFVELPGWRAGFVLGSETTINTCDIYWGTLSPIASTIDSYSDAVAADSPISHWRLDETTGTAMTDAAGTNDGTFYGGPTLSAPPLIDSPDGTAVTFDGSDDYFTVPHNAALNASAAFTIECWIKPTNPTADGYWPIVSKSAWSGVNGQWTVFYDNRSSQGSPQRIRFQAGGAWVDWEDCAEVVVRGGHLVCTVSGAGAAQTLRIYWNGTQVATSSETVTWSAANTRPVENNIGTTFYFDGTLDELAIYGTELSAARILAHFEAGLWG